MKNLVLLFAVLELAANAAFAATVDIHRVIPSKILYQLNEEAVTEIVLQNTTDAEQKGTLKLVEEWGLDESRSLGTAELALAAHENRPVRLTWQNTDVMYGRAVRAEFQQGDAVVSTRREFYAVADDWWRVGILNGGGSCDQEISIGEKKKILDDHHIPDQAKYLIRWAPNLDVPELGPFVTYGNLVHWFAWAPSDFGELTPQENRWFSGQGLYDMSKEDLLKKIAAAKRWGMKCSAYTANYPGGPAGFEFARQHPEWIRRTETGAFGTADLPVSPLDMAKPTTERPAMWCAVNVDGYWPEAIAHGAQELAASSKMFGWDAWYFDFHYVMQPGYSWDGQPTPHGQNPDELSARNVRLVRDTVLKECRRTFFWQNGGCRTSGGKFEGTWGNHGGREGRLAMLEHPQNGTLAEFQAGFLADPNNSMHAWRSFFEVLVGERNDHMVKKYKTDISGTVEFCGPSLNAEFYYQMTKEEFKATRDEWTFANHYAAMLLALNIHPFFVSTWSFRPVTQFMTRYSALLWDPRLKVLEKPDKLIKVECLREVWWEECVYTRETDRQVDTMIHLINSPVKEGADIKASEDPPAVDDAEISFKIGDTSPERFTAWALQPYSYDAKVWEPVQTRLKTKAVNKSLIIEVPAFNYYTLVVIRQKQ